MRRCTLSPGERRLQKFPLQRYWLRIFGGDTFQIPRRRVARSTVPAKVRLTRFRVPCHNVQSFVAVPVRHIQDGLMQEVRNIADLLGRESKARHPLLRAALDNNGCDRLAIDIVQHQHGAK